MAAATQHHVMSLDRFNDLDIACMDFDSWRGAESVLTSSRYRHRDLWVDDTPVREGEYLDELVGSIRDDGLKTPVEIMWWGPGTGMCMYDGHHRIIALKRLGFTEVPYRWFNVNEQDQYRETTRWCEEPLPARKEQD